MTNVSKREDNEYGEEYGRVSPELDELSSTLMGAAFDMLAEGEDIGVLLALQSEDGSITSFSFSDDGPEALLDGARDRVRHAKSALRYAIAYEGAVELEDDQFADAVLLEFGERGTPSFSAYSLFEGRGAGDAFRWTDPAPAGEEEPLLG